MRHGHILAALLLSLLIHHAHAEGAGWFQSLGKARAAAGRARKPILCIVADRGDTRADRLVKSLGTNRKLADLFAGFVPVRLDRQQHADLVRKYDLKLSPATVFFTDRGVPIKVVAGPVSVTKFAAQMEAVLEKYRRILNPSLGAREAPERHEPPPRPANALPHGETCPESCPTCAPVIQKALAYLARMQRPDGRLTKPGSERITTAEGGQNLTRSIDHIDVALTSLAGLAFLATGSTLEEGTYSRNLRRAAAFVAGAVRDNGIICAEKSDNYTYLVHANFETPLGAVFLSEMQELAPERDRAVALARTAEYLMRIQDPRSGAYGYSYDFNEFTPNDKRGWRLLATTHCCLTALNHMRDAGVSVREEACRRAAQYLLACRSRDGSFTYRSEFRMGEGYPGASGGALYAIARSRAVPDADLAAARARFRIDFPTLGRYGKHWWFNLLFAALTMHDQGPGATQAFHRQFRDVIAGNQREDGGFDEPDGNGGSILATAVAAIVLSLPQTTLPLAGKRTGPGSVPDLTKVRYLKTPHPRSRVKVIEEADGYLVDLVVSTDGEADAEWGESLKRGLLAANRILYDITDGGMSMRRVTVLTGKERWDEADLMITTDFYRDDVLPQPFAHGFTMVSKRTEVKNGRERESKRIGEWVKLPFSSRGGATPYSWDHPALVRVLAHELGHYLFGARDEYNTRTGESYCECLMGKLTVTELCSSKSHTDTRQESSCQELALALYPNLRFATPPDPGPWDPPEPKITLPE
jgi:hypothetical protein